jgi:hypothetical protein
MPQQAWQNVVSFERRLLAHHLLQKRPDGLDANLLLEPIGAIDPVAPVFGKKEPSLEDQFQGQLHNSGIISAGHFAVPQVVLGPAA